MTQFGVNLLTLPPGAWSSQRHWHTKGDELIYVVSGEVVLVTDEGEDTLRAGDSAGFKAGDRNGHHLQNRSASDALIMEIGTRVKGDEAFYPDIDLRTVAGQGYAHRDGTPYPKENAVAKGLLTTCGDRCQALVDSLFTYAPLLEPVRRTN